MHMRWGLALFLVACSGAPSDTAERPEIEGDEPGECSDGADNDGDGQFDCLDSDCAGAAVCCPDVDLDGVCDTADRCPGFDDLLDGDNDGLADGCDPCPLDASGDGDEDGVCDSDDRCPGQDDKADVDGDGTPDACDSCPDGDDSLDADQDGFADACDPCPQDNPDDTDGDGICDSDDVCPGEFDPLCGQTGVYEYAGVPEVYIVPPGVNNRRYNNGSISSEIACAEPSAKTMLTAFSCVALGDGDFPARPEREKLTR